MELSLGDNVRVRPTPATTTLGIAGLVGQVYGQTMPSITNVDVIGEPQTDIAFNVFFEIRNQSYWLDPALLEFQDHAPGTEIRLEGVPKKWTRSATGEWTEEAAPLSKGARWWFW